MCIQEKMIWGLLVFNDPVTNGFQNSNFILVVKYISNSIMEKDILIDFKLQIS